MDEKLKIGILRVLIFLCAMTFVINFALPVVTDFVLTFANAQDEKLEWKIIVTCNNCDRVVLSSSYGETSSDAEHRGLQIAKTWHFCRSGRGATFTVTCFSTEDSPEIYQDYFYTD